MAKSKEKVSIEIVGKSGDGVTGSMYYITYNDKQILLEAGLYQTSGDDVLKQYRVNHRNYKVPFADIDAVIISHFHIDHCGLIPYLFARGYCGNVYIPKGNKALARIMWEDSLKIFESDCAKLEKRYNMKAAPLYTQEDIEVALEHLVEIPFGKDIVLFDDLTMRYYRSSHIVNAAQVYMTFKLGETVKRLGFTGDIGSDIEKDYIQPYEPLPYCDVLLAECTYGNSHKTHKQKDRDKDIEKIKCVVDQCCQHDTQKVLFGSFSLNRLQDILTTLYKIYGDDETFATPIIVDAPLGIKISALWDKLIEKDFELWKKVSAWKNIVWVSSYEESQQWQRLRTSQVVISTSNFLKNGRVVSWLKSVLPNANARVMLCGYAGDEESVAYQIQHNKKWVVIDGDRIANRANVMQLTSFSSHACRSELLQRYTDTQYNKIYLVHSESKGKQEFAKMLRESLSNANRAAKVYTPVTSDKISF